MNPVDPLHLAAVAVNQFCADLGPVARTVYIGALQCGQLVCYSGGAFLLASDFEPDSVRTD